MNPAPNDPRTSRLPWWTAGGVALAGLTTGCDPVVNFYGSFFPAWVVALGAGLIATTVLRWIFAITRIEPYLGPLVIVYPALVFLASCLTWLAFFAP